MKETTRLWLNEIHGYEGYCWWCCRASQLVDCNDCDAAPMCRSCFEAHECDVEKSVERKVDPTMKTSTLLMLVTAALFAACIDTSEPMTDLGPDAGAVEADAEIFDEADAVPMFDAALPDANRPDAAPSTDFTIDIPEFRIGEGGEPVQFDIMVNCPDSFTAPDGFEGVYRYEIQVPIGEIVNVVRVSGGNYYCNGWSTSHTHLSLDCMPDSEMRIYVSLARPDTGETVEAYSKSIPWECVESGEL